jgi:hypothetical protein
MEEPPYLRRQADRCRRLARIVSDPVTREQLEKLAGEFEARADAGDAAGTAATCRTGPAEG